LRLYRKLKTRKFRKVKLPPDVSADEPSKKGVWIGGEPPKRAKPDRKQIAVRRQQRRL
jgi:hypothetical protein